MSSDEMLKNRIREALVSQSDVIEKNMFGGVCFMVNGKMCIAIGNGELMCRVGEENYAAALDRPGAREMDFTGRPMKGYVFVSEEGIRSNADFRYWIELCLAYNPKAKASVKKKGKTA